MPGLMKTFEGLIEQHQEIARQMSNAARAVLEQHNRKPDNSDHAARFDEACAVYLLQSRPVVPPKDARRR